MAGYATVGHGAAEQPVFKLTSAISSFVFNPAPYNELAIVIDVTAAVKTNRRTFWAEGIFFCERKK
ncbi:hypothetical protein F1880_008102 [Penicillium rolfsii]|nr:hypothetical protein F1880_008102 [Penicillium rolfsii]